MTVVKKVNNLPYGLKRCPRRALTVTRASAADVEEEKRCLEKAKEKPIQQLNALAGKAREGPAASWARVFLCWEHSRPLVLTN